MDLKNVVDCPENFIPLKEFVQHSEDHRVLLVGKSIFSLKYAIYSLSISAETVILAIQDLKNFYVIHTHTDHIKILQNLITINLRTGNKNKARVPKNWKIYVLDKIQELMDLQLKLEYEIDRMLGYVYLYMKNVKRFFGHDDNVDVPLPISLVLTMKEITNAINETYRVMEIIFTTNEYFANKNQVILEKLEITKIRNILLWSRNEILTDAVNFLIKLMDSISHNNN